MLPDYYHILGLNTHASKESIKSAFKTLAKKYHPDKNPNDKKAEEKFKEINEAYQVLSDLNRKKKYDDQWHYQAFQDQKAYEKFNHRTFKTSYTSANSWDKGDFTKEGKHYQKVESAPKVQRTYYYFIGIALFIIIMTAALLLGGVMNRYAAEEHYQEALKAYQEGNMTTALDEIQQSIHFQEDFVKAYQLRAKIRFQRGFSEGAVADLMFSHSLDSAYEKAIEILKIKVFQQLGNPPQVFKSAAKILIHEPNNDTMAYEAGKALGIDQTKYSEALPYFALCLKIKPKHQSALYARAYIYLKLKEAKKAMIDLEKLGMLLPQDGSVWALKGEAWILLGNRQEACNAFQKAIVEGDLDQMPNTVICSE